MTRLQKKQLSQKENTAQTRSANQFQCVPYHHSFLCSSVVCQKLTRTHCATTNRVRHEKRTGNPPPGTQNHPRVDATSVTLWCVCRDKKKTVGQLWHSKLDRQLRLPRAIAGVKSYLMPKIISCSLTHKTCLLRNTTSLKIGVLLKRNSSANFTPKSQNVLN